MNKVISLGKRVYQYGITRFFSKEEDLQLFFFNMISLIGFMSGIISFIVCLINGITYVRLFLIVVACFVFLFFFWLANWKGMPKIASFGMVFCITVILFPVMFFFSGGTYSGLGYWFAMGLLFTILLLDGKWRKILLYMQIIAIVFCYYTAFHNAHMITYLTNRKQDYVDILHSLILLALCIGMIINFQKTIYLKRLDEISAKNQELDLAKMKADEANHAKTDFLAKMSHEIRTPINAVLGFNEVILRECRVKEVKENSLYIKSAANTLLSIINEILDSSKIESGEMEIVDVEYDMNGLLNDLYNMTLVRAKKKNLQLYFQINENIPSEYIGDDVRIRQVLLNLLSNAVKYTEKGIIQLIVSGQTIGDVERLSFSVKDTGIGIEKEELKYLFDQFRRTNLKNNRFKEGAGLGLNISDKLLKLMGSKLEVESTYGKGSTFFFFIDQKIANSKKLGDFKENLQLEVEEHNYVESFRAPNARILVVDDNEMNLMVVKGLLKYNEIKVTTAKSGRECLELVHKEHFDLILLDHMMPEMDGLETLKHIKSTEHQCVKTPIIMFTANAVTGAKEMYLREGADGFLTKPVLQEALDKILLKFLPEEMIVEQIDVKDSDYYSNNNATTTNLISTDMKELPEIEGFFWEHARLLLSDTELLSNAVLEFYKRMDGLIVELDNDVSFLSYEDARKLYCTNVHSLKSNAMMVGALTIAELSRLIERNVREEKLDLVNQLHPILIEELKALKERMASQLGQFEKYAGINLKNACAGNVQYKEMDVALLLDQLEEDIKAYDFNSAITSLRALERADSNSDTTYLSSIEVNLEELEFDKALDCLAAYKEKRSKS